jgi:ABC-2 type transport system permease protein
MSFIALIAIVRKDLQVYYSDRRAVIMGFIVPITVASFMGAVFGGTGQRETARIPVGIVDQDATAVSKAVVAAVSGERALQVSSPDATVARDAVRRGTLAVAVIIPKGFAADATRSFFGAGARPDLDVLYDPSRSVELSVVHGIVLQNVMEAVSREAFAGAASEQLLDEMLANVQQMPLAEKRRALIRELVMSMRAAHSEEPSAAAPASGGVSLPYVMKDEAVTSGRVPYNFYAHAFAGMSVQFLLFAMIDLGVGLLLERQRGLWKRLRSAPISRQLLLGARAASGSSVAMAILLVSFAFAGIVFGVRIQGSIVGFLLVCLASALMASTFGLLVASLGRTPGGSRGLASLAVLLMVMLGGAWMPTFLFPAWLQQLTLVIPTRWAIDGLDAMTWRGLPFSDALTTTAVLLGFAMLFGSVAVMRFRWEEQ